MRLRVNGIPWIALVLLLGCGQGATDGASKSTNPRDDFSPVIAKIGDVEITQNYFDYRFDQLTPEQKARYAGEEGKRRFLESLTEEMLVSEEAEREGFDRIREVQYRLDMARRSVLFKAYHDRRFGEAVEVPDSEVVAFYEQNPDQFRALGRVFGSHIQCASEDKIRKAYAELQDGHRWDGVCLQYSEDEETRENAGQLGWFNRGGYVLGLGFNEEFTDFAFSMEPGTYSEPVQIDGQWHIIKIGRKVDDTIQPLEEVRDRIVRTLQPIVAREAYARKLRELKREMGVEYFGDYATEEKRSADQLYRIAGETADPHARLDYYQKLVDLYPEHERADEALFMVGFIASEEFGDTGSAAMAFRRLAREYPESEFVESARWMLGNLGRANPRVRGERTPKEPDTIRGRIEKLQQ